MTPVEMLAELRRRGVTLTVDGENLRFSPKDRVADLRDEMVRLKPHLVRMLKGERCYSHSSPAQWEWSLDQKREGFHRVKCRFCGAFIGYNQRGPSGESLN